MTGKFIRVFIIISAISCSSEKINISPVSENIAAISSNTEPIKSFGKEIKDISSASEITNLISNIPKFQSKPVNRELGAMKNALQLYLYALEAQNTQGENRNLLAFKRSYQKLQKFKVALSPDEQETLNRFLVRIKTNVSRLEDAEAAAVQPH